MTGDATDALSIRAVATDERRAALEFMLGDLPPENRAAQAASLLAAAETDPAALTGLIEAHRGGRRVGVILASLQAGRTALVQPSRTAAPDDAAAAQRLLAAALGFLTTAGTQLAQALLEMEATETRALYASAGFRHAADLEYLVADQAVFPTTPAAGELEFEPYSATNHPRLARVIEATYQGTLDCPQLDDVRTIEDVLDGYRGTGVFGPDRWLIVRHQEQDAGCLLLADHPDRERPDQGHWELVYMGLVPWARGRGWGKIVARHAMWLARQAGRRRLALAVDSANTPALRTWLAAGFVPWTRRAVYLKQLQPS